MKKTILLILMSLVTVSAFADRWEMRSGFDAGPRDLESTMQIERSGTDLVITYADGRSETATIYFRSANDSHIMARSTDGAVNHMIIIGPDHSRYIRSEGDQIRKYDSRSVSEITRLDPS